MNQGRPNNFEPHAQSLVNSHEKCGTSWIGDVRCPSCHGVRQERTSAEVKAATEAARKEASQPGFTPWRYNAVGGGH